MLVCAIVLFVVVLIIFGIKGGSVFEKSSIPGNLLVLAISFLVSYIAEILDFVVFSAGTVVPPFEFAFIIFILIKIYNEVRQ